MTSVPKPLKFMIPHYDAVKAAHDGAEGETITLIEYSSIYRSFDYFTGRPAIRDASVRRSCADVVSVLAMTMGGSTEDEEGKKNKKVNETLEYKLKGNYDSENVEAWGHEYMR